MVENKQSINTVLSFGAKSVNPKILEQLLTGRAVAADFMEDKVNAIIQHHNNQFWLIIGQRGMGKTHLLSVLHSRIQRYVKENKLVVAYFAEEEYGVDNFFDFLLRILNSFIKWYDQEKAELQKELQTLQNTSSANQLAYLEKIIKKFIGEKPLLILTENFGDILGHMGNEEQGRLRSWLYENDKVSIIATSQSISDDFDKEDRPFYGFFTTYYLKNLSFDESYYFLLSLAELDKDEALIEHLKTKGKSQVRAIYDLVKGNHRLLVTFYHFLKADTLAKVSENFIKTINDLKPYYETYIRYLPPQQQKILRYIALARKPQKGTEISKSCFIEQKSLSKQMSELSRKNLVDIITDPSDKRNKFYDISEPLLRISIEVGEHREGITTLFIDFLAHYYNIEQLLKRNNKFSELLDTCNEKEQKDILYEIQAIHQALDIKKEKLEKIIITVFELVTNGDYDKAKEIYFTTVSENKNEINTLIALHLHQLEKYEDALTYFRETHTEESFLISPHALNDTDFYKRFTHTLIKLSEKYKQPELIEEAIELTHKIHENNGIITDEYVFSRLLKGADLIVAKKNDEAKLLISKIINLDFEDYSHRYKFIILEIVSYLWNNEEEKFTTEYLNYLDTLSADQRTELYKNLSGRPFYYTLFTLSDKIEKDIKEGHLNEILSNWIINILMNSSDIVVSDLKLLIAFIQRNLSTIPELTILESYAHTYLEVIFNKNEAALYELPKEQRIFFEQKILKREKK
ncbi:helix-turn-helix domain-containing protein [Chryseobacterium sp. OV279]|uniref:helix-turn-helix domain-containing protein n=1 Tax=Chryseobacterium sp. OV279 TaxID=1500285 RepID=UPI0009219A60|nr:helix-turn-helix domain-containing protein [Chryseobacterium sp. OV279]SHF45513.1 hypothetical protein SAMN02787100_2044 [Chryseobacterium sp. OV279]